MSENEDLEHAKWAELNNLTRASVYDFSERLSCTRVKYTHEYISDFSGHFYMVVNLASQE